MSRLNDKLKRKHERKAAAQSVRADRTGRDREGGSAYGVNASANVASASGASATIAEGGLLVKGPDTVEDAAVVASSRWQVDGAPLYHATRDELVALLPFPADDANKYTRGKLTLVAGSDRYPGAAVLAARAAERMGAGYIEVITTPQVKSLLLADSPSLVVSPRKKWDPAEADVHELKPGHPQALCIGPGFDANDQESVELVHDALRHAACPVLVDGGALSALMAKKGRRLLRRRFENGLATVVTPHLGEAIRLAAPFELPTQNPARLASLLSLSYGFTAVVKGPDTFVSDGERTFAVTEGASDLAKAGTGDVLAGVIGSLMAQNVPPVQAAVLGATLHAQAGRLVARRFTTFGVRAEDVAERIPQAIVDLIG